VVDTALKLQKTLTLLRRRYPHIFVLYSEQAFVVTVAGCYLPSNELGIVGRTVDNETHLTVVLQSEHGL